MGGRFPPPGGDGAHAGGLRLGDRAAARAYLSYWRHQNPATRLVVLDDLSLPECRSALEFGAPWLASSVADEIWMLEPGEAILRPTGNAIYNRSLWSFWQDLRCYRPNWLQPDLPLPPSAVAAAEAFLGSVPRPFVCIQPLVDVAYNHWRNAPPQWWAELIGRIRGRFPVVALGTTAVGRLLPGVEFAGWHAGLSPMESLAVISRSALFVGGETGLPLWAPLFRTPTVAFMAQQSASHWFCTAPISFGAPVRIFPLEVTPEHAASLVLQFADAVQRLTPA